MRVYCSYTTIAHKLLEHARRRRLGTGTNANQVLEEMHRFGIRASDFGPYPHWAKCQTGIKTSWECLTMRRGTKTCGARPAKADVHHPLHRTPHSDGSWSHPLGQSWAARSIRGLRFRFDDHSCGSRLQSELCSCPGKSERGDPHRSNDVMNGGEETENDSTWRLATPFMLMAVAHSIMKPEGGQAGRKILIADQ